MRDAGPALTFADGGAVLRWGRLLGAGGPGDFPLRLRLGLAGLLGLPALLVQLLELGGAGGQPLLPGAALLLLPALPGSLHGLGHLRLHELLPWRRLVLFVLDGLLPEHAAHGGLLPREEKSLMRRGRSLTGPFPRPPSSFEGPL